MVDWCAELTEQLDWYWTQMFRPRLEGLTDDEYLWEPVEGCWSVRPTGDGRFTVDWSDPEPSPPPFTTIAWRLAHIGSGVLGLRANAYFGDGTLTFEQIVWPGTAADAIAFGGRLRRLEGGGRRSRRGRGGPADRAQRRPVGGLPVRGPGPTHQPRGHPPRRGGRAPARPVPRPPRSAGTSGGDLTVPAGVAHGTAGVHEGRRIGPGGDCWFAR